MEGLKEKKTNTGQTRLSTIKKKNTFRKSVASQNKI
jgi:hypothetical protein